MMDCKRLKGFFNEKIITFLNGFVGVIFAGNLFAATLQVGNPTVVLMAGETIEIPLYSTKPISGDLTARGAFHSGDVSFTPSPACHLSSRHCALLVRAAPTSKKYTGVPVVVSESGASNKPVFVLSVIRPGEPAPVTIKLPEIVSTPLTLSDEIGSRLTFAFTNATSSTLNNLTAVQLPSGVGSGMCPTVAPGATCMLRLVVNDVAEAGDAVISIQSDQGILQDRILSIKAPKVMARKLVTIPSPKPAIILTGGNLSATIIPHTTSSTFYTSSSNGPVYQMIQVTNTGGSVTLDPPVITGPDASYFSIDTNNVDYSGTPIFCNDAPTLATGESCEIIITSALGDPVGAPATATLTISDGAGGDTLTFSLTDTTYVYAGGGFNTLGSASVSGGNLLAQCTAGTCSNALQGTTGNNYAATNSSVGEWINALAITSAGNLIVGGVFGEMGGATSGASGTPAALLAQCMPGPVTGNACINQINTPPSTNSYAFNNAYIDAITAPFLISGVNYVVVGGDFNQIKNTSATSSGRVLAKCRYNGMTSNQTCNSYLGNILTATSSANKAISALNTLGSTSNNPRVNTGGLFTQIAGYPSSAPVMGTTFASCTTASSCSQGMGSDNPNNSILGMSDDGTNFYMGGTFTQIGGYIDSSGGYPLVSCLPDTITTCTNALAGPNDANGYIEGLFYSGGKLYVGGNFTTIGGSTPVSGNMLAVCTPGGTCSNFVTDTNPYATGTDWGGGIFAIAVGNQTSIAAN